MSACESTRACQGEDVAEFVNAKKTQKSKKLDGNEDAM